MRLAILLLATLASAVPIPSIPDVVEKPDEYEQAFEDYMRRFHKNYTTTAEREVRFEAFRRNYDIIRQQNAEGHSYTLGLTEFADLTPEEFARAYALTPPEARGSDGVRLGQPLWPGLEGLGPHEFQNLSLPASVDWRKQGAVTAVKNQGQCGACWAFSTTGSLEAAWHIAAKQLISLSEQQFVDCTRSIGNNGCSGGSPAYAYQYANSKAICTEESYSYSARDGQCGESRCTKGIPRGGVLGFKVVRQGDERSLLEAVAQQPVAVAIEADQTIFQLYRKGIISQTCGSRIDHGVLLVGYGTDRGQDYWLIKNSWGEVWGESGYGRLARGVPGAGECGILTQGLYPVVDGGKALWYYSLPWGLVTLAVLGLGACAITSFCMMKARLARQRQSRSTAPPLLQGRGRTLGHAPASTVAPQPAQALAVPAPSAPPADPGGRTGNSAASRLLRTEP